MPFKSMIFIKTGIFRYINPVYHRFFKSSVFTPLFGGNKTQTLSGRNNECPVNEKQVQQFLATDDTDYRT